MGCYTFLTQTNSIVKLQVTCQRNWKELMERSDPPPAKGELEGVY